MALLSSRPFTYKDKVGSALEQGPSVSQSYNVNLPGGVKEILIATFKETHQADHQKFVLQGKLPGVVLLLESCRELLYVF